MFDLDKTVETVYNEETELEQSLFQRSAYYLGKYILRRLSLQMDIKPISLSNELRFVENELFGSFGYNKLDDLSKRV